MSRVFNISSATDAVSLDASGRGSAMFTVTNASGRALRGRFTIKPLDAVGGDAIAIEGEPERNFNANDTQQVPVKLNLPPGTAGGRYRFRLDGVSVDNPDEDFTEGPVIAIEAKAAAAPKKPVPWWIYAIAVLVLAAGAALAYWATNRAGMVELVAVTGPYDAARQRLEAIGLVVAKREEATAAAPAGDVLRQSPTPAEQRKVKKGSTVTLTVAARPAAPATGFAGAWVNKDTGTGGVSRLIVEQAGTVFKIHAFGRCHPADCDWGVQEAPPAGNQLVSNWDQGFVVRSMVLAVDGKELKMSLDSTYRDGRPSQHSDDIFVVPPQPFTAADAVKPRRVPHW